MVVCEEVCHQGNLFDDEKCLVSKKNVDEIKEAAKTPEIIQQLEERVKNWCKKLAEVLKESEQIRRENDSSGIFKPSNILKECFVLINSIQFTYL